MNAVNTQIWIGISVYVMIAIMKKLLKIRASLYKILQILSVFVFEKTPISQLLTESNYKYEQPRNANQLMLWDLR